MEIQVHIVGLTNIFATIMAQSYAVNASRTQIGRPVPRNAGTYYYHVLSYDVLATSRQTPHHLFPFLYSYVVALEDLDGYDLDGSPGVISASVC